METITAEWLRIRLEGDRGKKAELAEALGIGADKVSKMISGARKPQAEEIPKILAFFGATSTTVDPELAEVWQQLEPSERLFLLNAAKAQLAARDQSQKEPGEEPQ
jgi:DNA-binding transcriptional regulator YdaS (Cro superfamily)